MDANTDIATSDKSDVSSQKSGGGLIAAITKITFCGWCIFLGVILVLHLANIGRLTAVVAMVYVLLIKGGLLYYLTGKKRAITGVSAWFWSRRKTVGIVLCTVAAIAGVIMGINFVRNTFVPNIQILIFLLFGMLALLTVVAYVVYKKEVRNCIRRTAYTDDDYCYDRYDDGCDGEELVNYPKEDETPAAPVAVIEAIARIDERVGGKIYHAYGAGVRWAWISYTDGFKERGGIGRIHLKGAPIEYADVTLAHNGYMEIHAANVVRIDATASAMPLVQPVPCVDDLNDDFVESTDTADTVVETPKGQDDREPKEALPAIDFNSLEGAEKWFRILFHGELVGFISSHNTTRTQSLTINPDGNAYALGSAESVFSFGQLPNESTWDRIIEMLETNNFFAENREGKLFVSWTLDDDEIW